MNQMNSFSKTVGLFSAMVIATLAVSAATMASPSAVPEASELALPITRPGHPMQTELATMTQGGIDGGGTGGSSTHLKYDFIEPNLTALPPRSTEDFARLHAIAFMYYSHPAYFNDGENWGGSFVYMLQKKVYWLYKNVNNARVLYRLRRHLAPLSADEAPISRGDITFLIGANHLPTPPKQSAYWAVWKKLITSQGWPTEQALLDTLDRLQNNETDMMFVEFDLRNATRKFFKENPAALTKYEAQREEWLSYMDQHPELWSASPKRSRR